MIPKEKLAATITRAGELRDKGLPLRRIAEILEAEGYPPAGNRSKWHHAGVRWCLDRLDREKASAPPTLTVTVHGPYTRTDSLLWDFLLHTVWSKLDTETDHTLPLERGLDALRAVKGRPDREHLWDALDRLAASRVKLEGTLDRHQLTITTPLLAAVLTEDTVSFHFPPPLVKLVKNPQQYTRLQALLGGSR